MDLLALTLSSKYMAIRYCKNASHIDTDCFLDLSNMALPSGTCLSFENIKYAYIHIINALFGYFERSRLYLMVICCKKNE